VGVTNRRNRDRYGDARTIFPQTDSLKPINPLAAFEALENLGLFFKKIGGEENGNRLSDDFL